MIFFQQLLILQIYLHYVWIILILLNKGRHHHLEHLKHQRDHQRVGKHQLKCQENCQRFQNHHHHRHHQHQVHHQMEERHHRQTEERHHHHQTEERHHHHQTEEHHHQQKNVH